MFYRSGGYRFYLLGLLLLAICTCAAGPARAGDPVPVKDTVTMVDLGSDSCLPCRMMTPILAALQKEYQGKAAIIFIDVYRENTAARKFHARVIPTQIFFDRHGKEVSRHEGFLEKEAIIKQLDELLAPKE